MLMEYFNKPMQKLTRADPASSFWHLEIIGSVFTQLAFHLLGLWQIVTLCWPWNYQIPHGDKASEVPILINTAVF